MYRDLSEYIEVLEYREFMYLNDIHGTNFLSLVYPLNLSFLTSTQFHVSTNLDYPLYNHSTISTDYANIASEYFRDTIFNPKSLVHYIPNIQ